ncbi:putative NAD(+) diphosphatase [Helianthus annuus]|uniref:NAD(+) diphosphatase n=1 Tax=Helianthus annuus TaxID=4232 RepID=A0A251ULQ3_HELAN|nr:nudix hydrolase 19, chloroplastic [Helianthus annuus]KAF5802848.1 putative NAD(+) diphosphatase [Helianthus annuus]KAJ0560917.1 putative NAD(+) diphosphatase [Helianthus annuus]KAJ0567400.1 putative NAD(+) diphosphatase [Helianthus annuus]KAJ0573958.1 putative NAD(+) diphosphatase [Helianthus annuus]KAJ0912383.1 putative NAD(+) diphosphatase [Helianthus annuus]
MSINLKSPVYAGNPIRSKTPKLTDPCSPTSALQTLKILLSGQPPHIQEPSSPNFKVLPFKKGRPLAGSTGDLVNKWHLGWLTFADFKDLLEVKLSDELLVYLGCKIEEEDSVVYWAFDVSEDSSLVQQKLGSKQLCFVELRTLMVATDWADDTAMGQLAIAGHARALLEWHNVSRFCGSCGEMLIPAEAGRRKQCIKDSCKKRIYPRVDPVVIMLVIDKENDRALLSKQSRFVPRMWSCLAGFLEPGESLEEAVRRETWEETGIEVGEVVYHSSQPWPVGPSSMPCQLMIGFFAYATSLDINVDKSELEDAKWHSREEVKKALTYAEYERAQKTSAYKVDQMCKGFQKGQNLVSDSNIKSGELAPMFVPGPYAIAHHLISSWAHQVSVNGSQTQHKGVRSRL